MLLTAATPSDVARTASSSTGSSCAAWRNSAPKTTLTSSRLHRMSDPKMATMTSTSSRMEWSVWRWKPSRSPLPQDSAMAGKRTRLIEPASSDAGVARVSAEAYCPACCAVSALRATTMDNCRKPVLATVPATPRSTKWSNSTAQCGRRAPVRPAGPPGRGVQAVAGGERQEQRRPTGADDESRQQADKADRAAEHVPDRGALHLAGTELHATDEGVTGVAENQGAHAQAAGQVTVADRHPGEDTQQGEQDRHPHRAPAEVRRDRSHLLPPLGAAGAGDELRRCAPRGGGPQQGQEHRRGDRAVDDAEQRRASEAADENARGEAQPSLDPTPTVL